jgi:simple sugar transport system permease protein
MTTATPTADVPADERLVPASRMVKLFRRPEVGAAIAAIAVLIFFSVVTETFRQPSGIATWLESSATIGIMAVAVGLLMIGGEFDLSAGVMTGFSALITGVLTTHYGVNVWVSVLLALIICLGVGMLNGILVMKTQLPSFIVTLGTFFVLQGVDLALLKAIIGQVSVQGMAGVPGFQQVQWVLASQTSMFGTGSYIQASVWWCLAIVVIATWILTRTKIGNWIFAVGGAVDSARQTGVPVFWTKVGLFMGTAFAGWLVGQISLFRYGTAQSSSGVTQELIFIICAVVGGCAMTGGFGSAIGPVLGALIYGMTNLGIVYAGWDNNWLKAFLGVMLLLAVLLNNYVRKRSEGRR